MLGATGVLGLCVGSFLNVVAYRLPRECMSVVKPRSRCPRCARPIAWYDNLPVLSWVLLRGRCRGCSLRISPRYPLVELLTGVLFLVTAWTLLPPGALRDPLSAGGAWLTFGVMAVIVSSLVALSLIDVDYRILPDEITKPGILLGPVLAFLAPSMQHGRFLVTVGEDMGTWGPRLSALASGVVGAVSAAAILWLIGWLGAKAFRKEAMGFGDVKMMAAMGGCLGAWALLSLVVAAFSGAAVGLAVRLVSKGRYIPFGPFLALGMWTVMLWGPALLRAYLGK